jgi:hypothetical protein
MHCRSHQICFAAYSAEEILHRAGSRSGLAPIFEANIRIIDRTLSRGPEDRSMLDRHASLDDVLGSAIVASVLELFSVSNAVTLKEVLRMVQMNHNLR